MKLLLLNIFLTGVTKEVTPRVVLIKCKKCGKEKGEEEFYWRKNGKIFKYTCKDCTRIHQKTYGQSEAGRAAQKKWRESEAGKAKIKAWEQSEAGKAVRARIKAKRRSKDVSVVNDLTTGQWEQIIKDQNHCCNGCGVSFEETTACKDHIIPVFDGGGLTEDNVQALCGSCNSTKGSRSMQYLLDMVEIYKKLIED